MLDVSYDGSAQLRNDCSCFTCRYDAVGHVKCVVPVLVVPVWVTFGCGHDFPELADRLGTRLGGACLVLGFDFCINIHMVCWFCYVLIGALFYSLMVTVLVSKYVSRPVLPLSRPKLDCFQPPKGIS